MNGSDELTWQRILNEVGRAISQLNPELFLEYDGQYSKEYEDRYTLNSRKIEDEVGQYWITIIDGKTVKIETYNSYFQEGEMEYDPMKIAQKIVQADKDGDIPDPDDEDL